MYACVVCEQIKQQHTDAVSPSPAGTPKRVGPYMPSAAERQAALDKLRSQQAEVSSCKQSRADRTVDTGQQSSAVCV